MEILYKSGSQWEEVYRVEVKTHWTRLACTLKVGWSTHSINRDVWQGQLDDIPPYDHPTNPSLQPTPSPPKSAIRDKAHVDHTVGGIYVIAHALDLKK